ncbi:hypothetical protein [Roseovarius phycicola]|uniref:Roadblock/LAMTOR2 domain-containing protein n=1 Tax=Roseovarius phycicola TaxID=3080976 RepID=A0ABZ2HK15_9RHOB
MNIEQVLDAGRKSVAGCSVAAFGDTSARLILRASHREGIRREYLDALCDHAASCFDLLDATWDVPGLEEGECSTLNEAAILAKGETMVFVRSDHSQSEFLCLVTDDPQAAPKLFSAAHRALQKISAVQ